MRRGRARGRVGGCVEGHQCADHTTHLVCNSVAITVPVVAAALEFGVQRCLEAVESAEGELHQPIDSFFAALLHADFQVVGLPWYACRMRCAAWCAAARGATVCKLVPCIWINCMRVCAFFPSMCAGVCPPPSGETGRIVPGGSPPPVSVWQLRPGRPHPGCAIAHPGQHAPA